MNKLFLLDANVFMQPNKNHYAPDICPGFLDAIAHCHARGRLASVDRVKDELLKGDDNLVPWAKARPAFFLPTNDAQTIANYHRIASWVRGNEQFFEQAKPKFLAGADGWLIAHAKSMNRIVVTEGVHNSDIRKKVPIPNVCEEFQVEYIDTFAMLRALRIKFERRG